jgi:PTS system ascorbate-specific IIB component
MKIVTIWAAGIGSAGVLKVNAERVLRRLGIEAEVVAADLESIELAADAQVILISPELSGEIGPTFADVIVVDNYFDTDELTAKLEAALGS